jgi:release factor glutamine methyltransferase
LGTGGGIQAIAMLKANASVIVCADINPLALIKSKENIFAFLVKHKKYSKTSLIFLESNLFSSLSNYKFDFIAFNPPYVPTDKIKWVDLDGGKKGREVIDLFIPQVKSYLNKKGILLLLISSLNNKKEVCQLLKKNNFSVKVVGRRKIFFEELLVLKCIKF